MNKVFAVALLAAVAGSSTAFALEPIQGSINYGDAPASRLEKAPVGSPVFHQFFDNGDQYRETYIVQPDRTLKLVDRQVSNS